MAGNTKNRKVTPERVREVLDELERSGGNISQSARTLGVSRRQVQHMLTAAELMNEELPEALPMVRKSPPSKARSFLEIRSARVEEYRRVAESGDSKTLNVISMPDDGPFGLIAIGDPHYDDGGTDLELYEHWTAPVERQKNNVYGLMLGDLTNNWLRVLGHLWGEQETTKDESFVLIEEYLKRIAKKTMASCSGNHDDWASADLVGYMMRDMGILHRQIGIRLMLEFPTAPEFRIYMRHRFPGNSMWNPVHAISKAAQMGMRDHILVGGDKHISGEAFVKDPQTGLISNCIQVASFKKADRYGDELGLKDHHVTPAVGILVNPMRACSDKQKVQLFHDPLELEEAVKWLRKRTGY